MKRVTISLFTALLGAGCLVSSCALPEVDASTQPSDAGTLRQAHKQAGHAADSSDAALAERSVATVPEGPAGAAPAKPKEMSASDAGHQPEKPAANLTVMPPVQSCHVELGPRDVTQTIWVMVDGSGSMVEQLDDKSRWLALREALLDNTSGVVRALEQVHWGLALYDGPLPGPSILPDGGVLMPSVPAATTCPRLIYVDPKAQNFATINAAYPLDPLGGSTPTHTALSALSAKITTAAPAPNGDARTSVVLATDGEPNDFCSMASPPPDRRPDVIAAVQKLAQVGIKTFVISLAGGDHVLNDHLQQVAQAGGSGQPAFIPASRSELIDALRQIATLKPSCEVKLARALDPLRACDGVVQFAGKPLTCNAADGFSVRDENRLRLTGSTCAQYQADPDGLDVSYPCDALR